MLLLLSLVLGPARAEAVALVAPVPAVVPSPRFTWALFAGADLESDHGIAPTVPFPLPAMRIGWADGWQLDVESTFRLQDEPDMSAAVRVGHTFDVGRALVPFVRAGVAYGNRDFGLHEAGGRMGVGPTVGAGVTWQVLPRFALEATVDGDVFWSSALDAGPWHTSADLAARLGIRFDVPLLPSAGAGPH